MENGQSREAVILAGGLGTRLRRVISDRPKPMAPIGSRPFLDYLVSGLISHGFDQIVICVSYMREKIIDYFSPKYGPIVKFSVEEEALGTAGALRYAADMLSQRYAVLNGDSYIPLDYGQLFRFHMENHADVTIVLDKSKEKRYGRVSLDGNRVLAFAEKGQNVDSGLVNAGVYVIERTVLGKMPHGKPFSLEWEFIPMLIEENARVIGYASETDFIDIGEPESYFHLLKNPSILKR